MPDTPAWSVAVGNSGDLEEPVGTGRLLYGGEYVGTLDLAFAVLICRRLNFLDTHFADVRRNQARSN